MHVMLLVLCNPNYIYIKQLNWRSVQTNLQYQIKVN